MPIIMPSQTFETDPELTDWTKIAALSGHDLDRKRFLGKVSSRHVLQAEHRIGEVSVDLHGRFSKLLYAAKQAIVAHHVDNS